MQILNHEYFETCQQLGQPAYSLRQPGRRSEETEKEKTLQVFARNFLFDDHIILDQIIVRLSYSTLADDLNIINLISPDNYQHI